jgi:hypothetical protein
VKEEAVLYLVFKIDALFHEDSRDHLASAHGLEGAVVLLLEQLEHPFSFRHHCARLQQPKRAPGESRCKGTEERTVRKRQRSTSIEQLTSAITILSASEFTSDSPSSVI